MDLGQFARSRLVLRLWLIVPLALIVAAILPSRLYLDGVRRTLAERKAMLESIMPLESRLRDVDGILMTMVGPPARGIEATAPATRRISQTAQRFGFSIRTTTVEKDVGESDGMRTVRISVQGQGSLLSIIRWLDALQAPGLLLRVEAANLVV